MWDPSRHLHSNPPSLPRAGLGQGAPVTAGSGTIRDGIHWRYCYARRVLQQHPKAPVRIRYPVLGVCKAAVRHSPCLWKLVSPRNTCLFQQRGGPRVSLCCHLPPRALFQRERHSGISSLHRGKSHGTSWLHSCCVCFAVAELGWDGWDFIPSHGQQWPLAAGSNSHELRQQKSRKMSERIWAIFQGLMIPLDEKGRGQDPGFIHNPNTCKENPNSVCLCRICSLCWCQSLPSLRLLETCPVNHDPK